MNILVIKNWIQSLINLLNKKEEQEKKSSNNNNDIKI